MQRIDYHQVGRSMCEDFDDDSTDGEGVLILPSASSSFLLETASLPSDIQQLPPMHVVIPTVEDDEDDVDRMVHPIVRGGGGENCSRCDTEVPDKNAKDIHHTNRCFNWILSFARNMFLCSLLWLAVYGAGVWLGIVPRLEFAAGYPSEGHGTTSVPQDTDANHCLSPADKLTAQPVCSSSVLLDGKTLEGLEKNQPAATVKDEAPHQSTATTASLPPNPATSTTASDDGPTTKALTVTPNPTTTTAPAHSKFWNIVGTGVTLLAPIVLGVVVDALLDKRGLDADDDDDFFFYNPVVRRDSKKRG